MRQIVLDTETTGLEPAEGHRIIEIGCVEMINRRLTGNRYHQYLNPDREIDPGAIEVHGITNEMLADKPRFTDVAREFLEFVRGAELIIHNALFDVGFLNHELVRAGAENKHGRIEDWCTVTDTLKLARSLRPGQKNDLDSLCRHYGVDNSARTLHGALLDAEILADVYLAMTGGQTGLFEDARGPASKATAATSEIRRLDGNRPRLPVPAPTPEEWAAHESWMQDIDKKSGGKCVWKQQPISSDQA
jgi:DNA polymerase-3 subunit epsilon